MFTIEISFCISSVFTPFTVAYEHYYPTQ